MRKSTLRTKKERKANGERKSETATGHSILVEVETVALGQVNLPGVTVK